MPEKHKEVYFWGQMPVSLDVILVSALYNYYEYCYENVPKISKEGKGRK